jgi:hypothetical protein
VQGLKLTALVKTKNELSKINKIGRYVLKTQGRMAEHLDAHIYRGEMSSVMSIKCKEV